LRARRPIPLTLISATTIDLGQAPALPQPLDFHSRSFARSRLILASRRARRWMLPAHIQKIFLKALFGAGLGLQGNCYVCPPVTRPSECEEEYMEQERKSNRGFASMDRDKQREIARKGGRSVPNEKRSFSQNHQLASEAGRKGGHSSHGNRRASAKPGSQ